MHLSLYLSIIYSIPNSESTLTLKYLASLIKFFPLIDSWFCSHLLIEACVTFNASANCIWVKSPCSSLNSFIFSSFATPSGIFDLVYTYDVTADFSPIICKSFLMTFSTWERMPYVLSDWVVLDRLLNSLIPSLIL